MANAAVRVLVRNTYVECVSFSSPNTILQHKQSNSSRKPTHATSNIAQQLGCDRYFPTAAHTQGFRTCFLCAQAGCGEMQHPARIAFASESSRCGRLRRDNHLCFGGGTHKRNLRSACGETLVPYMRKRKLTSLKQTECLPGASYMLKTRASKCLCFKSINFVTYVNLDARRAFGAAHVRSTVFFTAPPPREWFK